MRTIELIPGVHSSALGFGCAPILGSVDSKKAKYALDLAFDHGVNHLDLARSYGYGQAEEFIGRCIYKKRDKVILTSKFGIKSNWKASLLAPAKPLIRFMQGKKTKSVHIHRPAENSSDISKHFLKRVEPLRGAYMRKSLELSLKKLKTDYLDYFFVHEPLETLYYIEEIQDVAQSLKKQGKIKGLGISFRYEQKDLHSEYIQCFDLLQTDCPPNPVEYQKLLNDKTFKSNILFSPFKVSNLGLTPLEKLRGLSTDFPQSVILCSMFNPEHLKENIRIFAE